MSELGKFIRKLLFENSTDVQQIQNEMASSNLQPNLKNLLSKLLAERLVHFKTKLISEEGMMPKLLDFDWRVDIKMDSNLSDSGSKSGQQTCILNLKVNNLGFVIYLHRKICQSQTIYSNLSLIKTLFFLLNQRA